MTEKALILQDYLETRGEILPRKKGLTVLDYPVIARALKEESCPIKDFSVETFVTEWWQKFYDDLGINIEIATAPILTEEQIESVERYRLMLLWIPKIQEKDYPKNFVKLSLRTFAHPDQVERRPLNGEWVLVETIAKPESKNQEGYPNDTLLGLIEEMESRFDISWNDLHEGNLQRHLLSRFGKKMSFENVSLPTAEQWNWTANVMNHIRVTYSVPLPDLGATHSGEWCENAYGTEARVYVGFRLNGGLAGVGNALARGSMSSVAFRILVTLDAA